MKKKLAEFIGNLFSRRQYKNMVKKINFGKPYNVLDVGGSSGFFAREVFKKLPKKCEYTIIDVNEKSLNSGKKRFPNFKFKLEDAEKMNFKDNEFDLVICKDVLHHCKNPEKAINEIKRVGKQYIIIEARRGDRWLDAYLSGHNHFTEEKFLRLVNPKKNGFLDILWPRFRYMLFFLILPIIPKSKKSFMVAYD
tara:strand:- start:591 stop:1172 length:582 start_codon:yes stop_codon:yes gene_type:complete